MKRFDMRPGYAIKTLSSLGFVLLLAHSTAFQQANWPPGRVVFIHPLVTLLAWGLLALTLVAVLAGRLRPDWAARAEFALPYLAWGLLLIGAVAMPLAFPGPYE